MCVCDKIDLNFPVHLVNGKLICLASHIRTGKNTSGILNELFINNDFLEMRPCSAQFILRLIQVLLIAYIISPGN